METIEVPVILLPVIANAIVFILSGFVMSRVCPATKSTVNRLLATTGIAMAILVPWVVYLLAMRFITA